MESSEGCFAVRRKSGQKDYTVLSGAEHLSKVLGCDIDTLDVITAEQRKKAEDSGLMCHINPTWAEEAQL